MNIDSQCSEIALALERHGIEHRHVVDHRELALGLQALDDLRVVLLGLREAGDHVDLADAGRLQLAGQGLRMVDHRVRAERQAPGARLGARGGGDHAQLRELARELDQDRADAAGAADDQQRLPGAAVLRHPQPVEQQLVGGDGGQRQRGGLRVFQALRCERGDAFVDHVQLAVGAGAGDRAGVVHAVAGLESADRCADGLDRADRVPAQHLGAVRRPARAPLRTLVSTGFTEIAFTRTSRSRAPGAGSGRLEVFERGGVVDGEGLAVADGFHGGSFGNESMPANVDTTVRFDKLVGKRISFK